MVVGQTHRLAGLVAGLFGLSVVAQAQDAPANPATVQELPEVIVIGTTPLPGIGLPLDQIPANVQTAGAKSIERQNTLDLSDFLNQNLNGVSITETQDNPFQPDVTFRGFTASPLLGTPEGISVYVDGVRVNESFGDIVNWDLIPQAAIANVTLMPGSNPIFGLNTLGGALAVQTKSGADFPGTEFESYAGSFNRRSASLQTGGTLGHFDYYIAANDFAETGWRDLSPSRVEQWFGKLGWQNGKTDVDLSYAWAKTDLTGNGLTPQSLLDQRRQAIFTAPDDTQNQMNFVNLRASRFVLDDLLLAGNVYYRHVTTRSLNGDVSDDYPDHYAALTAPGGACAGTADPDGCASSEANNPNGVNHRSRTAQRTVGLTVQFTYSASLLDHQNQLVGGVSIDDGRSDFTQSEQDAEINAQRETVATGDIEPITRLLGTDRTVGVFASDTFSITPHLHLTASARYNNTHVVLDDRDGTDLDGNHRFDRLNPALGLTYNPTDRLTLYTALTQGSRAPTPIELGCADPNQPCKLPNAFSDDPALKPVVARTVEIGGRGHLLPQPWLNWNAALYHTINRNDIQFIASTLSGSGYFDNVGTTRRQGGELGLSGTIGPVNWQAEYSVIDATYRTPLSLVSASNSTTDDNGFIEVPAGSRLPLIARSTGKVIADYPITRQWQVGANLVLSSSQFDRGNENNRHVPGTNADGEVFSGSGRIPGYAVLNLNSSVRFATHWELFGRINNVFDHEYATAAQLTSNPFNAGAGDAFRTNPADWTNEAALSPSAPRAFWGGLKLHFE